jgi:hypothetical protein
MKRIIYDVSRWHLLLHREARGRPSASDRDTPQEQFEDELFDRLYAGDADLLPEKKRNPALREWAEKVHAACEQLPAFGRLVQECKGRPAAAATAVEALMSELEYLTESQTTPAQQQRARRRISAACEKASAAIDELIDTRKPSGRSPSRACPGPVPDSAPIFPSAASAVSRSASATMLACGASRSSQVASSASPPASAARR